MKWTDRVFPGRYDRQTNNVARLVPYDTKAFFYVGARQELEEALAAVLESQASS